MGILRALGRCCRIFLFHRTNRLLGFRITSKYKDAGAEQALLHAFANTVDLLQFEAEQNFGQFVMGDDGEPVGLLQIGADLPEKDPFEGAAPVAGKGGSPRSTGRRE
jgi:hypothetical protein